MLNTSDANESVLCQSAITSAALPTIYAALTLIGLPGNLLALWVFQRSIGAKTSTHIYLLNLGISNLLFCATMPFLAAYHRLGWHWRRGDLMCRISVNGVTPVVHVNICISVMILSWVALSRLASLVQHSHAQRPSRWLRVLPVTFLHQRRHAQLACALCVLTWATVGLTVIPFVVVYSLWAGLGGEGACYSAAVEVGGEASLRFSTAAVCVFFFFFLLVLASYVAVVRHIWRSRRSVEVSSSRRVYRRVLRNIVVIVLVLVVCLLPHHVYKATFVLMVRRLPRTLPPGCHPLSGQVEVKSVLVCLTALRCSSDPLVYFLLDNTFRRHALAVLRRRGVAEDSHSSKSKGQVSQATDEL